MGMIQDFQKADEERRGEVRQLQHEVATMLKDFDKDFAEDCAKEATQRKSEVASLRSDVATMLKELAREDSERKSGVATIRSDVATMLKHFDREFAEDCAKEATQRKSEVASLRSDVATMLKDFDREFAEDCAKEATQRKSGVASMRSNVATMIQDFAKGDTERASEVANIHEMVWGRAPAKKMAAPPVEELPKEMPPTLEAPAGEFSARVLAYLAEHPDGTRLVELEEEFGVARIQIAKVIRSMIDDNLVEKRELLYFAI